MASLIKLNNGKSIPSIALGMYLTPPNEAQRVVADGLDVGYTHIDTAYYYHNEKECCNAISEHLAKKNLPCSSVFYTTKLYDGQHGYEEAKKAIAERIEVAKSIEYIDLILIHSPQSNYEKRHGTWLALQEAVDSGLVKSIGVSNYGIKHIKELLAYPDLKYKPVINQIEIHPWCARTELATWCQDNGIAVEAYSPFATGKRFGDKTIVELSKKYGVSEGQILVKWSLQRGLIPLPKSVKRERMESNLDVGGFELSSEEMKLIAGLNEDHPYCWDPTVYPLDNE